MKSGSHRPHAIIELFVAARKTQAQLMSNSASASASARQFIILYRANGIEPQAMLAEALVET